MSQKSLLQQHLQYIHQNFQFNSYLYSEGFYQGVCSGIFFFFLVVDSILWFMKWYIKIYPKFPLNLNVSNKSNKYV